MKNSISLSGPRPLVRFHLPVLSTPMEFSSSCHISVGLDVFCKKIAIMYHLVCHEKRKVSNSLSFIMLWTNVIYTCIYYIYKCQALFDTASRVFMLCWSTFPGSENDVGLQREADTWFECFQCKSIGWCLVLISDFIATNFLLFFFCLPVHCICRGDNTESMVYLIFWGDLDRSLNHLAARLLAGK